METTNKIIGFIKDFKNLSNTNLFRTFNEIHSFNKELFSELFDLVLHFEDNPLIDNDDWDDSDKNYRLINLINSYLEDNNDDNCSKFLSMLQDLNAECKIEILGLCKKEDKTCVLIDIDVIKLALSGYYDLKIDDLLIQDYFIEYIVSNKDSLLSDDIIESIFNNDDIYSKLSALKSLPIDLLKVSYITNIIKDGYGHRIRRLERYINNEFDVLGRDIIDFEMDLMKDEEKLSKTEKLSLKLRDVSMDIDFDGDTLGSIVGGAGMPKSILVGDSNFPVTDFQSLYPSVMRMEVIKNRINVNSPYSATFDKNDILQYTQRLIKEGIIDKK